MSFSAKTGELSKYRVERELNLLQYAVRNFSVGLACEEIARCFGLVTSSPFSPDKPHDLLSFRTLDYFQRIPETQAKKVEGIYSYFTQSNPASTDSIPTNETTPELSYWIPQSVMDLKEKVTNLNATQAVTAYVTKNQEWLAVTSSVIGIYSFLNYMTANKIKNNYARNIGSMAAGIGFTLLGAYALGTQLDIVSVSDIGLRMFGYHQVAKFAATPAYWTLGQFAKVTSIIEKPISFPTKKPKAS